MATDTIIIKVKDKSKFSFLVHLLEELGFVDIDISPEEKKSTTKHDFFKSAGLLKRMDITAYELRKNAWKRNK